jgi:hypothetical protein
MTLAHEVSDPVSSELGRRIQPTYGYYRQPNGWITVSPITRLEKLRYVEQGWVSLDAYGAFDMGAYTANHPFEGLFMFGGAKEMSVEQILQNGLYIDPPLVPRCRQHLTQFHRAHAASCWRGATPVEFPQLADVPKELIGPFVCDFCQRKMPTNEAREQHQSVAHTEPLGDVRTGTSLGKALAEAMNKASASATPAPSQDALLQKIADLEKKVAASADEKCACGGSYRQGAANPHKRGGKHRNWANAAQPV